jgi:hypothetical protein
MVLAVSRHAWLHGTPPGVRAPWEEICLANPSEITACERKYIFVASMSKADK